MKRGKLLIFSAPSGSGKTTIVNYLLKQKLDLEFSVSATSRQPRPGEREAKDYYFLSEDEFRNKIKNNEFLEWEEVYEGIFYGTLKSEVERIMNKGKNIILDLDVMGGLNIKRIYGSEAISIFIRPPTLEELKRRLQKRSTENENKIRIRLAKAKKELHFASRFDVIIINNELPKALEEIKKIIFNFLGEKRDQNET